MGFEAVRGRQGQLLAGGGVRVRQLSVAGPVAALVVRGVWVGAGVDGGLEERGEGPWGGGGDRLG